MVPVLVLRVVLLGLPVSAVLVRCASVMGEVEEGRGGNDKLAIISPEQSAGGFIIHFLSDGPREANAALGASAAAAATRLQLPVTASLVADKLTPDCVSECTRVYGISLS